MKRAFWILWGRLFNRKWFGVTGWHGAVTYKAAQLFARDFGERVYLIGYDNAQ